MSVIYREVDPTNYKEVYTFNLLHEYSLRDSWEFYVPDSEPERETKTRKITEELQKPDRRFHCLAAFSDERQTDLSLKMIGAHFLDKFLIDKILACHIHGLYVDIAFRKQGVARKLKELGEVWAKDAGCIFMDTNVRVNNYKMIGLNEDLGYEIARLNFRKTLI